MTVSPTTTAEGWTVADTPDRPLGAGLTDERALTLVSAPEVTALLGAEPFHGGADAYVDRQVDVLRGAGRVVDRGSLPGGGRLVTLSLGVDGRAVTADLAVRVRDGIAEVCSVLAPPRVLPHVRDDIDRLFDWWTS